jgi:hypothetical protein
LQKIRDAVEKGFKEAADILAAACQTSVSRL